VVDSPRTRPAKPALSRDSIVAATLGLVDELGCAAVSMRRVAQALDTAAASLYVHVADRDELMRLAHDRAVREVELPTDADGDWRARLELLVHRTVETLARHGDIATVGRTDAAAGPAGLRIIDELLRLMRAGGIPDGACAWAIDLLGQHVAAAALEGTGTPAHQEDLDPYPTLRELAPLLRSGTPAARARWKLRVLLDGLRAQP
jgi:AcrR family transcriptional regulator